jgi:hypothetical protein
MSITVVLRILVTISLLICSFYGSFQSKFVVGFTYIGIDNTFSGAWLVLPTYIIYVMGSEILQGLTIAAGGTPSDDSSIVKSE